MNSEHHKGHRERLRKKFISAGVSGLHDYELLELLLTYAIPLKDVKPIAKNLLAHFGDLASVIDASPEELACSKGIGMNSAILISLIKNFCCEYLAMKMKNKDSLSSPDTVINFARMKMAGLKAEGFMVVYLNTKNHVNDYEIINEGTVDHAVIYPRNIIKRALAHDATGIIMVHNHPSGICEPSHSDIKITGAIKEAAKTVNIRVIDHIIVGKSGYFSFVEAGIL